MMHNKVAIVTGAGKGIGKAIALALAKQGCDVVVASRTQSDIDSVAKQIEQLGRKSLALRCDVSVEDDVQRLIDETFKQFGKIDILVNNAGIGTFASVADLSVSDFDKMWGTNMRGTFLCTKSVLPYMKEQKSGEIINIASLAGRNAFKGGAGYAATKWAMIGFARCLMLEVREHNIRVITICPGSVDTEFHTESTKDKDTGRVPKAEDIAQIVVDALKMPRHVMVSEIDVRPTNPNW
ncbi:MAG: SDR family NAD(P)-dependent oxidoreductase [Ignavibacteriae bacterium]|nr:SDR family NAD(P)-dependent oxidoreductase [Ignavibacteriota bacterium]